MTTSPVSVLDALVGVARAGRAHMQEALADLRQARESLQDAAAGEDGHTARAIDYLEKAIVEVEEALIAAPASTR